MLYDPYQLIVVLVTGTCSTIVPYSYTSSTFTLQLSDCGLPQQQEPLLLQFGPGATISVVTATIERIVLSENNVAVYDPATYNVTTYDDTLASTIPPSSRRLLQDTVRAQVFVTACGKPVRRASVSTNKAGHTSLAEGPVGTFRGQAEKPESNADICKSIKDIGKETCSTVGDIGTIAKIAAILAPIFGVAGPAVAGLLAGPAAIGLGCGINTLAEHQLPGYRNYDPCAGFDKVREGIEFEASLAGYSSGFAAAPYVDAGDDGVAGYTASIELVPL